MNPGHDTDCVDTQSTTLQKKQILQKEPVSVEVKFAFNTKIKVMPGVRSLYAVFAGVTQLS